MRQALLSRLKRLETRQVQESRPALTVQFGRMKPLPREYDGERHVVTVNRFPDGKYEWEEQPGPPLPGYEDDDHVMRVCFVAPDRTAKICSEHGS